MYISVDYNLSDKTAKTFTFSNDDFLRATGVDWQRANKMLRINYIKNRIKRTEFCWLILK